MSQKSMLKEIDDDLVSFSNSLSPASDLLKEWNADLHELMQDLKSHLKGKYNYSIDRHIISGSVRKNTAIIQPDYDCVVFLNDIHPPFESVIEGAAKFLKRQSHVTQVYTTKYSVGFMFNTQLKVDLLPAINLVQREGNLSASERIKNQRKNVLKVVQDLPPSERRFYSSSLSESQVEFMKVQSDFVLDVVKLAKFWYKALCCDPDINIPGLKYLIELVAVFCAQKEEKDSNRTNRSCSVTQALTTLFKTLAVTKELAIEFLNGNALSESKAIQQSAKKGFVLDPANPFNDLLEGVKHMCRKRQNGNLTAISQLEQNAKKSLSDWNNFLIKYRRNNHFDFEWLGVLFKTRIFESISFDYSYTFAVCFTYFSDWGEYMDQMNLIENPETTDPEDMDFIENVFKICSAVETHKHRFTDDEGNWWSDDNEDMQQTVMETIEDLQDGIIEKMEDEAKGELDHCPRLQEMFKLSHAKVRPYSHGRSSLKTKLNEVRKNKSNSSISVFHVPAWEGPSITDKDKEVLYCCCLIVVD